MSDCHSFHFQSIYLGNTTSFSILLSEYKNEELNKLSIAGQSLLHLICLKEDIYMLNILLSHNVDVSIQDWNTLTKGF